MISLQFPEFPAFHGKWEYLWAWYVTGFDPGVHCQKCLFGFRSEKVKKLMPHGEPMIMDEAKLPFDYLYVCGGAISWKWKDNFHLVLVPTGGKRVRATMGFTGQTVIARGASHVSIPALPGGFNGKDHKFTTCRNYQFGVEYYQNRLEVSKDGTYGVRPELSPLLKQAIRENRRKGREMTKGFFG